MSDAKNLFVVLFLSVFRKDVTPEQLWQPAHTGQEAECLPSAPLLCRHYDSVPEGSLVSQLMLELSGEKFQTMMGYFKP